MNKAKNILIILSGIICILFLWHGLTALKILPEYILPTISDTLNYTLLQKDLILDCTFVTFAEAFLGMVIAISLGYFIALILHLIPTGKVVFYPYLLWLRAMPIVAIAPYVTLCFGNDIGGKVFIAFFISFFSIVISSLKGLDSVPPELLDYFKLLGASKKDEYLHLRIPFSVPYLFVGAKITASISVIGAIVGEFVGSNKGLGYLIIMASHRLDSAAMISSIIISSFLTLILYALITTLEYYTIKHGYNSESTFFY